jgi:hypothetical protein
MKAEHSRERKKCVKTFMRLLDVLLLVAILAGLYVSSSQPYYKQDMRGTISRFIDEQAVGERLKDVSFRYGKQEISVEASGIDGFIEFFLRKGTHFATFALLALIGYRVLRRFAPFAVALPWSAFLTLAVAVLDEWHQTFTPDRTGQVADVVLDASGACTMLLLIVLARAWPGQKRRDKR